ncbi:hypothetical protein [Chryseobacterium sp. MP_3.2]|uniref:hypothetical protein n=1 Tax=Chryseobacterium sp. MP_3.2 TaxID=3071712 RepID=UPI002E0C8D53|nr:hypothetical protein [Chryseobacterium sp. MP_3.2]
MELQYTLVQKKKYSFKIWILNENGFGVERHYEIISNVPDKKFKGGTFTFKNPPAFINNGDYEFLCENLQTFVQKNFEEILAVQSSDLHIFKKLDFK